MLVMPENTNELSTLSEERITTEILVYKNQVGQGIIEIGKRLIEMKKRIGHGGWENYLKEKVDFTIRTAQKFMLIANEYSNTNATSFLGTEKLYLLLDVPNEEREEFIEQPHLINGVEKTVNDMTTRELQQAIKEKKELETRLEQVEAEKENANNLLRNLNINLKNQANIIKVYQDLEEEMARNPQTVEKIVEKEVIVERIPDQYRREFEQQKLTLDNLSSQTKRAEQEISKLEKEVARLAEYKDKIDEFKKAEELLSKHRQELTNIRLQVEDTTNFLRSTRLIKDFINTNMTPMLTTMHLPETNNVIKADFQLICDTLENWIFFVKQTFKID